MEWLAVIAALVALVWAVLLLGRGGLVPGCLAVLLAGSCFGFPFFNVPLTPLPLTADRLLLALLLVQYVCFRHWNATDPKRLRSADWILAAFLAALAVSTAAHGPTDIVPSPLSRLVIFYGMPTLLYWVARQAAVGQRQVRWVLAGLALFGLYLGATAIAEVKQYSGLVFPRYIMSSAFEEFLGRGRGPFLNPIGCGIAITVCLAATLLCWPRANWLGRLALGGAAAVELAGAYCSMTRSVWMGAGAALFLLLSLNIPRSWRMLVLSLTTLAVLATVAVEWEHLMVYKRDKDLDAELSAESAALRPILATVAWNMFLDRPLWGCGLGRYLDEKNAYLADRSSDYPLEKVRPYVQHNVFLGMLVENGLVGLLAFLALLGIWTRDAWRLWRSGGPLWLRQTGLLFLAFLAGWLPNGMFHDVSVIVMMNMFLFFLAGLVQALVGHVKTSPIKPARLPATLPIGGLGQATR